MRIPGPITRLARVLKQRAVRVPITTAALVSLAFTKPAAGQQTDTAAVSVGGVLFTNYQYHLRPAGATNRFDLERAYVTVSGPLANRLSFRITTDVYQQQRDTVDRSWQLRAKYAYLQYEYSRSAAWPAWVRLGMLQTVFIDHDESFWPRWISSVPTDRHGFFSSADVGVSTRLGLPARAGEIYATITNGPGFASREIDRYKDYAARLTLTPLARRREHPLRSLTLTAWAYKGALASRFAGELPGQVAPIRESLRRDRWGVFAAVAHPRATAALQYAQRIDEGENGSNTLTDPRVLTDSSGSVAAGYVVLRPLSGRGDRLSLIARWDRVNVNRAVDRTHDLLITGVAWDVSPRLSAALDLQATYPGTGSTVAPARTLFLHTQTRF